eukprot:gene24764-10405_t
MQIRDDGICVEHRRSEEEQREWSLQQKASKGKKPAYQPSLLELLSASDHAAPLVRELENGQSVEISEEEESDEESVEQNE